MKHTRLRATIGLFTMSATLFIGGCMAIGYDDNGDPYVNIPLTGPTARSEFQKGASTVGEIATNAGTLLTAAGVTGAGGILGTIGLIASNLGKRKGAQAQREIAEEKDKTWDNSETAAQNKLLMGMLMNNATATKPADPPEGT
jgi:selenophosphate synthetase-related protein